MKEEFYSREEREHFRPITGPENNYNDEWETDNDEQN